jgi:hypothetical protein
MFAAPSIERAPAAAVVENAPSASTLVAIEVAAPERTPASAERLNVPAADPPAVVTGGERSIAGAPPLEPSKSARRVVVPPSSNGIRDKPGTPSAPAEPSKPATPSEPTKPSKPTAGEGPTRRDTPTATDKRDDDADLMKGRRSSRRGVDRPPA